jgi:hypothetical protein
MLKTHTNNTTMKTLLIIGTASVMLLSACGNSKKDSAAQLNDKKAALEKLKTEKVKTDEEIKKLQDELMKLDTNAANTSILFLYRISNIILTCKVKWMQKIFLL